MAAEGAHEGTVEVLRVAGDSTGWGALGEEGERKRQGHDSPTSVEAMAEAILPHNVDIPGPIPIPGTMALPGAVHDSAGRCGPIVKAMPAGHIPIDEEIRPATAQSAVRDEKCEELQWDIEEDFKMARQQQEDEDAAVCRRIWLEEQGAGFTHGFCEDASDLERADRDFALRLFKALNPRPQNTSFKIKWYHLVAGLVLIAAVALVCAFAVPRTEEDLNSDDERCGGGITHGHNITSHKALLYTETHERTSERAH